LNLEGTKLRKGKEHFSPENQDKEEGHGFMIKSLTLGKENLSKRPGKWGALEKKEKMFFKGRSGKGGFESIEDWKALATFHKGKYPFHYHIQLG